ncbi:hypothetical protein [Sinorhizobium sp. A49]|uniref:hypothetical protein n=1 Tax=Sinorhizobium sp. A49 TaxID=1945861 RepID=UPI001115A0DD|nr:hypothetical protein [Sinorhizobium sp. A49]
MRQEVSRPVSQASADLALPVVNPETKPDKSLAGAIMRGQQEMRLDDPANAKTRAPGTRVIVLRLGLAGARLQSAVRSEERDKVGLEAVPAAGGDQAARASLSFSSS